jgi:hypothetical protein
MTRLSLAFVCLLACAQAADAACSTTSLEGRWRVSFESLYLHKPTDSVVCSLAIKASGRGDPASWVCPERESLALKSLTLKANRRCKITGAISLVYVDGADPTRATLSGRADSLAGMVMLIGTLPPDDEGDVYHWPVLTMVRQ